MHKIVTPRLNVLLYLFSTMPALHRDVHGEETKGAEKAAKYVELRMTLII